MDREERGGEGDWMVLMNRSFAHSKSFPDRSRSLIIYGLIKVANYYMVHNGNTSPPQNSDQSRPLLLRRVSSRPHIKNFCTSE